MYLAKPRKVKLSSREFQSNQNSLEFYRIDTNFLAPG